jgi:hypothetical protein
MTQRFSGPSPAVEQYRDGRPRIASISLALHYSPPIARTLPAGIVALGVAGYLGVLAAFWTFFGDDHGAVQSLAVVSLVAVVFFGVPYVMFTTRTKHGVRSEHRQAISDFLSGDFDTLTGPITGWSALVQYAFLPVALAFGAVAIGIVLRLVD